jgi:hypothetical protein
MATGTISRKGKGDRAGTSKAGGDPKWKVDLKSLLDEASVFERKAQAILETVPDAAGNDVPLWEPGPAFLCSWFDDVCRGRREKAEAEREAMQAHMNNILRRLSTKQIVSMCDFAVREFTMTSVWTPAIP